MSRSSRRLVTVLAAAALVSTVAACGGSDDKDSSSGSTGGGTTANEASAVGVTADTIKLGAHFPLTGPAAPGYSEIPTGAKAYYDYVNKNGGVYDRKIDYIYKDDVYNPTNTSTVVNQLVLDDQVFAIVNGLGTPTHSAVLDFLNQEGVPDLFVSSGALKWGDDPKANPYTFGWQTDYESEGKIIGQYVAENFPKAKVGLFLQDDDFGQDGEKGVRQFADKQIVSVQRYTSGAPSVDEQITNLQTAGADFVIGFNVPAYTARSQLSALKVGYKPQWFYSNVGSDPALVGGLLNKLSQGQASASVLDGTLTTDYLPSVDDTDNPWIQLFQKIWDESGQEGELTNYRVYGMSQAYTVVQALQAAGQNPTRDGLVDAVAKVGGDWKGPVLTPFRYSEKSHMGASGMSISRLKGAGSEEVQPIKVTDIGKAKIEDYKGKPAAPPKSGIPDEKPAN